MSTEDQTPHPVTSVPEVMFWQEIDRMEGWIARAKEKARGKHWDDAHDLCRQVGDGGHEAARLARRCG